MPFGFNRFNKVFEHSIFVLFFILIASIGSVFADTTFTATLDQTQETPPTGSTATGSGSVILNSAETQIIVTMNFSGLSSTQTAAHIHRGERGVAGPVDIGLPNGNFSQTFAVTPTQVADLKAGLWYFNVHSATFGGGEIRGQIEPLCLPSPSGLVAWYKGEGNVLDDSGNGGNNGTYNGSGYTTGKVGQAFPIGTSYGFLSVPDNASNSVTGQLTLSAWVKANTLGSFQTVISKKNESSPTGSSYLLAINFGRLVFEVDGNGIYRQVIAVNADITTNTFYHVAATFDPATQAMRVYLNGAEVPTTLTAGSSTISSIYDSTSPVLLGYYINSSGLVSGTFNGITDEAQIYNRELSATEIQNIYNSGISGVCTGISLPGSLDISFGNGGKVTTPIGSSNEGAQSVAIQTDGKIVTAGSSFNGSNSDFAVVRYNSDGSLDTSFGTGGKVTTPIGNFTDEAFSVAIQTDGKIVAAGYSNGSTPDFALVRYNADGSLDATFGTGGKVTTPIGSSSDEARAITIQTDGKIVAAGSIINISNDDFAVVRYNTDGSLDTSFGSGGKVTTPIGNSFDIANSVAIQTDGKILAVGYSDDLSRTDFLIVRYNSDGSLDTSFGSGGKVKTPIGIDTDRATSVAIQADGKIVAAGYSNNGSNFDVAVVRYSANGSVATPLSNLSVGYTNITQAGNTVATPLTLSQLPPFNNGYNVYGGGLYYDIRTSASYSGNITIMLNVPNVVSFASCSSLRLLHFENGAWTTNTNGTPSYNSGRQTCTLTQTVTSLSPFAVGQLAPTAASVSIAGRVLTTNGRGLRNASVSLIDSQGNTQTVRTSSFGNYSFEGISAGQTVTVTVNSKMYHYQPQVISVNENLDSLDFQPIAMKSPENKR